MIRPLASMHLLAAGAGAVSRPSSVAQYQPPCLAKEKEAFEDQYVRAQTDWC
jgi:hypothetical protein